MTNVALIWIGVAVVAAIIEVALPSFGFLFVSAAAVVAAAVAWFGAGVTIQVGVFVVFVVASVLLIRPRLVAQLGSKGVPSRTEALVGKRGRVTEEINPTLGTGRVIVAGEDWKASSDHVIPAGTDVIVRGADSIVLHVTVAG